MTDLPTVLVIDDEIRSLESLERILNEDFDVKTAATIKEAEKVLENEWVQVVLCDQRMPEQTGSSSSRTYARDGRMSCG
jgi:two-component system response regulator HupR/HoxA